MSTQEETICFYTKKQLCTVLSISLPTLNRHLADKTIPSIHIGSRVLIPVSYVQELESQAMHNVTAPQSAVPVEA